MSEVPQIQTNQSTPEASPSVAAMQLLPHKNIMHGIVDNLRGAQNGEQQQMALNAIVTNYNRLPPSAITKVVISEAAYIRLIAEEQRMGQRNRLMINGVDRAKAVMLDDGSQVYAIRLDESRAGDPNDHLRLELSSLEQAQPSLQLTRTYEGQKIDAGVLYAQDIINIGLTTNEKLSTSDMKDQWEERTVQKARQAAKERDAAESVDNEIKGLFGIPEVTIDYRSKIEELLNDPSFTGFRVEKYDLERILQAPERTVKWGETFSTGVMPDFFSEYLHKLGVTIFPVEDTHRFIEDISKDWYTQNTANQLKITYTFLQRIQYFQTHADAIAELNREFSSLREIPVNAYLALAVNDTSPYKETNDASGATIGISFNLAAPPEVLRDKIREYKLNQSTVAQLSNKAKVAQEYNSRQEYEAMLTQLVDAKRGDIDALLAIKANRDLLLTPQYDLLLAGFINGDPNWTKNNSIIPNGSLGDAFVETQSGSKDALAYTTGAPRVNNNRIELKNGSDRGWGGRWAIRKVIQVTKAGQEFISLDRDRYIIEQGLFDQQLGINSAEVRKPRTV